MRRQLRNIIKTLVVAVVALGGMLVPTQANATGGFVTCPIGYQVITYSPPITNTPQQTSGSISTDFGPCVSSDLALTSGTMEVQYERVRSCTDPISSGPNDFTIHWNNGQHSDLDLEATRSYVNGNFIMTVTGTVASGQFQGQQVAGQLTLVALDPLACATTGLSQTQGNFVLSILPL